MAQKSYGTYHRNYYLKHKRQKIEYSTKYAREHSKQINARRKQRYATDENYRKYKLQHNKQWHQKNKQKSFALSKEWYQKNREKMHQYQRERNLKIRVEVLIHYGGNPPHCVCCGERCIEFLTIDHIEGGGNKHRRERKTSSLSLWIKQHGFPDGFQVLCWNCNLAKAFYKTCPHEKLRV